MAIILISMTKLGCRILSLMTGAQRFSCKLFKTWAAFLSYQWRSFLSRFVGKCLLAVHLFAVIAFPFVVNGSSPKVTFILSDDPGFYSIGLKGSTMTEMPDLDRLDRLDRLASGCVSFRLSMLGVRSVAPVYALLGSDNDLGMNLSYKMEH
jgi:hypothetical protein